MAMTTPVHFRCSCGASGKASSVPGKPAEDIIATWRAMHVELGHHEVDQAEHKRIRARQRREEAKAWRV